MKAVGGMTVWELEPEFAGMRLDGPGGDDFRLDRERADGRGGMRAEVVDQSGAFKRAIDELEVETAERPDPHRRQNAPLDQGLEEAVQRCPRLVVEDADDMAATGDGRAHQQGCEARRRETAVVAMRRHPA